MAAPSSPNGGNPAAAFYASSLVARALGATLRWSDRLAPAWTTRGALRLFFTPLPWKLASRRPLPAPWQVARWPFEGVKLAVHRRDDLSPGRPLVLLVHGWAGSAAQMRPLADALAAEGFDPVLLDFPAHGHSGGWRATLPQFARAIFAAASRLGPLHAVVAHSLGALAALHASASGLPVQRLALIAPSAPPAQFMAWFAESFGLPVHIGERMRAHIERREGVLLAEYEAAWLGPRLQQPTLLLHDEADSVAPFAASRRLAKAIPSLRLDAREGLGHRRILGDEGVAAAVAAHLRGGGSSPS
jgi:pimeloyl-ACP methyl ester carboxylesterase